MAVCYYHVTYAYQKKSTLWTCLNVKDLAQSRHDISNISDNNRIRNLNHLVRKRILSRPVWLLNGWVFIYELNKWLWVRIPLLSFNINIFKNTTFCKYGLKNRCFSLSTGKIWKIQNYQKFKLEVSVYTKWFQKKWLPQKSEYITPY